MIFPSSSDDASRLRISAAMDGEQVRLALAGELDGMETTRLVDVVVEVVRRNGGRPIGIDATELTFLDSAGIRALLMCRRRAVAAGCRLSVIAASAIAYQVLEISGLLHILEVRPP